MAAPFWSEVCDSLRGKELDSTTHALNRALWLIGSFTSVSEAALVGVSALRIFSCGHLKRLRVFEVAASGDRRDFVTGCDPQFV